MDFNGSKSKSFYAIIFSSARYFFTFPVVSIFDEDFILGTLKRLVGDKYQNPMVSLITRSYRISS